MSRQLKHRKAMIIATSAAIAALIPATASQANAQGVINTEQYQELFINAGYSALFGAALGTAVLPFLPSNSVSNLRVIAGGASIGFIAGSLLALYNLRQQQSYGMQYYPETMPDTDGTGQWQWDIGSSSGKDVFVKMDSRF